MSPQLLSQILAASALAGIRTSWVLLALVLASLNGRLTLPPALAFLATSTGVSALIGLAVAEHWLEKDEDLQDLLHILQYALRGSGAAMVGWALQAGTPHGLHLPDWAVCALSGALAMATHHLRMRLFRALYGIGSGLLDPRTWLIWLETGGMVGLLAALVLAPGAALVLVILGLIASQLLTWGRHAADRRMNRRRCACGHAARKEASLCPRCRQPLGIERWLGKTPRGVAPTPALSSPWGQ